MMTVLFVTNIMMKALTVIPCAPLRRVTTSVLAYHLTIQDKKTESHCPKHKHLDGLWLMDSGATDHSTPFLADFLTYRKLPKPVNVGTAGTEVIQFLGIGTVAFKAKVGNVQK